MHCVDLDESSHNSIYMYLLAKIGVDIAENHLFVPLRYLQFLKIIRSTTTTTTTENELRVNPSRVRVIRVT